MDFCTTLAALIERAPTPASRAILEAVQGLVCRGGDDGGGVVTPQSGGAGHGDPDKKD